MPKGKPNKKKPAPVQSEIGNELHRFTGDGYKYHATFCPTWRTELDCGSWDSVERAQQAVIDVGGEFERDVIPAWHRETPDTWLASGHDGEVDTMLTIAKIVRVAE